MSENKENNSRIPESEKPTIFPTRSGIEPIEVIGTQVGPYKLLSVLGEGGFGMVYLAEQKEPVRRQVALKVIKPGMDSKLVVNRFEAERQALAMLDHPNIARVFDGGVTQAGRPYFVMELVKGLPITKYCDQHKLSIDERLRLFETVCEAIQHAHQKGIIHRDIKPSNVLVALHENKPVPKIIDFGVAKAINQPLTERTLFTEQGQLLGTPEYMSPEQANLTGEDIDTRSDIYSLGVLLYELLTGTLPFDSKTLRATAYDGIIKFIREENPPKPSTRFLDLGEKATQTAEGRRTSVRILAKRLQKELEWIPLKAMRKERERRYRTASDFADDIRNYLNGKPLTAGPESATYLFKKFVKRHQFSSAVVGLLILIILSFSSSGIYLFAKTAKAEQESTNIREEWANVSGSMFELYRQVGFIQFLELWRQDKYPDAVLIANLLGGGSKEKAGTAFLLDSKPVSEKESDFRSKISDGLDWFTDFVIAEQYLKEGNREDANKAFQRSFENIQQLDLRNQSSFDRLLINVVSARLYEFTLDNNPQQ